MEPSQYMPDGAAAEPTSPAGELVVQNGRQSGARRALSVPITLIGRAPGCDIRLNAKGVHLLHCALVQGPNGLVLRSLQEQGAPLVNGEPAAHCLLREGDLLSVGPFHFRVRLPPHSPATNGDPLGHEKEALRIQAAAVAAQQAALTEEESRLQQRRGALQKQEEQLAAHLEERRRHLIELREQVRAARAALRKERAAHAERAAAVERELERWRQQNLARQQQLQLRRRRLVKLQRGLRRRWRRNWDAQEAQLRRREMELLQQRHELEREGERLRQQRAALAEERLRFHGEVELGRRQLEDARQQLAAACRDRERDLARRQAELNECAQTLDLRAMELTRAEQDLSRRVERWEDARFSRERELEGLENRVRNQRRLLLDQQSELARLHAVIGSLQGRPAPAEMPAAPLRGLTPPAPATTLPAPQAIEIILPEPADAEDSFAADWQRRLMLLETLAAELADQRLHLAEQFERLLLARQRWHDERQEVAAELERGVLSLQERERRLDAREQALAPTEAMLRQRREEAAQVRCHLEAWRARLSARETAWEGEREALLADLAAREKLLQEQQAILAELRQHWLQRRQQEAEHLRKEQERCRESFHRYTSLWGECFRRHTQLEQEQRVLAEKALALEQYRLECIGQAENTATAERRLERLRRRWAALSAAAERRLQRDREVIEAQLGIVEERFADLEELAADLSQRELELSARLADEDQSAAAAQETQARLQQSLQTLRAQRDVGQWQLGRLREEVERMALTLLDEADTSPPAVQAA
jgi:pSer/pThr/pTyr-binding forkhead associated (FHA) protein